MVEEGVPLFDSHDEFDKDGKLVRKFGLAELQKIARNCNNRSRTTGDLAPWGPGHTKDDVATEDDQPPVRGYYHNYRVGKYGPSEKLAVLADCYVQRNVKLANGKVVDGIEYARGLPRRSVELWPSSMTIDWIAHLRRSPQRDLGLLANARDPFTEEVKRYSRDQESVSYSARHSVVGSISKSGKLRYSMESAMADDITPVDNPTVDPAEEMAPEGHEDFMKHLSYAMKGEHPFGGMCKKYAAEMASPTNAALPGQKPGDVPPPEKFEAGKEGEADEELLKQMRTGTGDLRMSKYQRELNELRSEVNQAKHSEKMVRYERDMRVRLAQAGVELSDADISDELLECAPLAQADFDRKVDKMCKRYEKSITGVRLPNGFTDPNPVGAADDPLTKHADEIIRYARDNNLAAKHGEKAFMEAAKILKYAK